MPGFGANSKGDERPIVGSRGSLIACRRWFFCFMPLFVYMLASRRNGALSLGYTHSLRILFDKQKGLTPAFAG
jgi:hypothetical protein